MKKIVTQVAKEQAILIKSTQETIAGSKNIPMQTKSPVKINALKPLNTEKDSIFESDKKGTVIKVEKKTVYLQDINTTKEEVEHIPTFDDPYFDLCIGKVLFKEGGYNNGDKRDRGGETNRGISQWAWKTFAKSSLNVEPTLENQKKLTKSGAAKILYDGYWKGFAFNKIDDYRISIMLFDWYMNTSPNALKSVHILLNEKYNANLSINGIINLKTANAINSIDNPNQFYNEIIELRKNHYRNEAKKPGQKDYEKGWLNRVDELVLFSKNTTP